MEVLTGIATHVRHTAEVYGDKDGVGTSQGVTFRVNGRSVEMWSPTAPQIEEGDEVTVAGEVSSGILNARAYKNHSSGATGRDKKWSILLNLLFYGVCGIPLTYVVVMFLGLFGIGPLGLITYPAVWAAWAWLTRDELKTRRALRLVRASRPAVRLAPPATRMARPVRTARPVRCAD